MAFATQALKRRAQFGRGGQVRRDLEIVVEDATLAFKAIRQIASTAQDGSYDDKYYALQAIEAIATGGPLPRTPWTNTGD